MPEQLKQLLTIAQALSEVGKERAYIHNFVQAGPVLLGSDWEWSRFLEFLKTADVIELAGESAIELGHPLAVTKDGKIYFFERE